MILIDDTLNTSVGNSFNDIKDFINAQAPSAVVGVGYMSNASVNVVQNFTADHDLAVKAVRLPSRLRKNADGTRKLSCFHRTN
jgi:hypothetical protein